MIKHLLGGFNVVRAVCDHVIPVRLWDELVPGKIGLEVFDSELDLPLLEALFLCREVVNIRVGEVVRLTECCVLLVVDDSLRHLVKLSIGISKTRRIHDVVVVFPIIEADQPKIK